MSYRKSWELREKVRFGGLGGLGGNFYCKYDEKRSQKSPLNYSASFWISKISISLLENPNPQFVMVLGPGGRDHDSQDQYDLSLEKPGHSK